VYYYVGSGDCSTTEHYAPGNEPIMKCSYSDDGYWEHAYCNNEDVTAANAPWLVRYI
jgi:hypothetical protein